MGANLRATRTNGFPRAVLWPWGGPARRARAGPATGSIDLTGSTGPLPGVGLAAVFLALDCPGRGRRVKGALRASLARPAFADP
jgi:hypothetical protein